MGVGGEVRIRWLTDVEANLAPGRTVYVGPDRTPYQIKRLTSGKRSRLKLDGVDSRQAGDGFIPYQASSFINQ